MVIFSCKGKNFKFQYCHNSFNQNIDKITNKPPGAITVHTSRVCIKNNNYKNIVNETKYKKK